MYGTVPTWWFFVERYVRYLQRASPACMHGFSAGCIKPLLSQFTITADYLDLRDMQYKSTKDDWMHHAYILTKVCEFDCALEVE